MGSRLVEVEGERLAAGDRPAAGPVYRSSYSPDGKPSLDGIATLLELFQ
jgi:hypothetical protein